MMAHRRVALINPNATVQMTDDMVAVALGVTGAEVVGVTNIDGPAAIQGPDDAVACLPGLFAAFEAAVGAGARVVIIGCFDDTGLGRLRARDRVPVVGLGEAGCLAATLATPRFVVVTSLPVSIPVIEDNIAAMGLGPRCAAVLASGVPVLGLRAGLARVCEAIEAAHRAHPECAIVLGCGGMSALAGDIANGIAPKAAARLIDPVRAAMGLAMAVQGSFVGLADPVR